MNKTELIAAVAEKAGLTKKDVEKTITATLETVKEQKCQQGHQGELCDGADDHVLGTGKYHLEVAGL